MGLIKDFVQIIGHDLEKPKRSCAEPLCEKVIEVFLTILLMAHGDGVSSEGLHKNGHLIGDLFPRQPVLPIL